MYSVPDTDDIAFGRKVVPEKGVPLNRIVTGVGDSFVYLYDFGDDWYHDNLLEAIMPPEADVVYPRCIAGARNGPPEDSGGPFRYIRLVEALNNSDDDEHEEMLEWAGDFDSEKFSVNAINASLKKSFRLSAAAKQK